MVIRKAIGKFVETELDGEVVVMNVDTGRFHVLKETGLAVWRLIDGERSLRSHSIRIDRTLCGRRSPVSNRDGQVRRDAERCGSCRTRLTPKGRSGASFAAARTRHRSNAISLPRPISDYRRSDAVLAGEPRAHHRDNTDRRQHSPSICGTHAGAGRCCRHPERRPVPAFAPRLSAPRHGGAMDA